MAGHRSAKNNRQFKFNFTVMITEILYNQNGKDLTPNLVKQCNISSSANDMSTKQH